MDKQINTKSDPIFKSIFGDSWNNLPPAMIKHYANRGFSDDKFTAQGELDIMCKWYLKPIFKLFKNAPPYNESEIPTTVHFISEKNSNAFCFDRIFYFKNKSPFHFQTKMFHVKNNEVMEVMNYGLCWHLNYFWNGEKILLQHKKYSLRIFGYNIYLPITWLLGRTDAEEIAISENEFYMSAAIIHPLLGKIYEYKGKFKMI